MSLKFTLYECHICGKQSPYEDDLEECSGCGKIVCVECSAIITNRTYCNDCENELVYDTNHVYEERHGI